MLRAVVQWTLPGLYKQGVRLVDSFDILEELPSVDRQRDTLSLDSLAEPVDYAHDC